MNHVFLIQVCWDLRLGFGVKIPVMAPIFHSGLLATKGVEVSIVYWNDSYFIVHAHLPSFLRYDIFHFSSSKSFQTGCHRLASFSLPVVSSPKLAAIVFTPVSVSYRIHSDTAATNMLLIVFKINPISQAPDKISKNPVGNFFSISMRSLYSKFQPSNFQTERGVWADGHGRCQKIWTVLIFLTTYVLRTIRVLS